ncbi:hypothetical protein PEL8287_00794 [Roseovarius litorisediminis]|uniref:DUF2065 domain-containing protein n=1 Tax=Roseovarius litorisediminis TaxID=1312363 RepID=A0A1Y5RK38_9RHOB|nr:DUF2065 domain-containing protein [Roseovarius litorisediminis]SLN19477.1 hypothetical protein PEL8287_00794 [Roseovarius litorisediminis]
MIENALLAFGLVLIVEGLVYALAPSIVEQLLVALSTLSQDGRRLLGLAALTIGVVMVWSAKMLGA